MTAHASGKKTVRAGAGSPARLLIVDDDSLSSSLQSHLASLLGHQATVQPDSEQAVELALSGQFDLMLLDLSMPKIDGFEVLRRLREREAQINRTPLPVVAVTGYASEADRLRCLIAGFTEHLSKPLQASVLADTIARVLDAGSGQNPPESDTAANDKLLRAPASASSDAERLRAAVRRLSSVKPGDLAFAPTVTESFALRSAQLIEDLRLALQGRNIEQATRAARAMKSSAEFLGALRLAQMNAELELRSEAQDWAGAAATLQAVEGEHQAVLTLLFESTK